MKSRKNKEVSTTPNQDKTISVNKAEFKEPKILIENILNNKPKHAGGRPPHYSSPETLLAAFKEYRDKMEAQNSPLTVSGFCCYIESYKDILNEYAKKSQFSGTIKEIYNIIENNIETGILTNKYNATAGIFNLKNNFGWKDKTEISGDAQNPLTIISNIPTKK